MQRVNLHTIAIFPPAPDVLTGCHGEGCHRMLIASPQLSVTTDSPSNVTWLMPAKVQKEKEEMKLNLVITGIV